MSQKFFTLEMQALSECFTICMRYTICPTCKAQGKNPCRRSSGKICAPHVTRIKQAHTILATPLDVAVQNDIKAMLEP